MSFTPTQKRILKAFKDLLIQNGYRNATTHKIAELAMVNETTIFRNFKDKRGLLQATIDQYLADIDHLKHEQKDTGNLEKDLTAMADKYQKFVFDHQAIFMIGLRESFALPEVNKDVEKIPIHFKSLLVNYLEKMQQKGHISQHADIEVLAMNFVWLNFGYFLTQSRFDSPLLSINHKDFLSKNIHSFVKELTC
ncbi:TetR/AcrR family transcriptional regulator [Liquorilactobacillus uvarum]|uniref:Transcriptional regulator n=1 Tax=Liquorilactobacillus uvarum DSM 19971 TaxID=1423812 RepID=A0A0R1Q3M6_9LACO|nr:TetR/AcrR family transcriptional regulator [Liquorilactobacillus uvarum]KRL36770.1 transcriptional regulator [Liquorilactobacillus uvarum DSM 19971]